jgi:pseudaminic acid synthase
MKENIKINGRIIVPGTATYIVAEMSANHNGDLERAVKIIEAAKEAGADAVKLQTYTADTITINSEKEYFRLGKSQWKEKYLYQLYDKAHTPWEWHTRLKEIAEGFGLDLFSTPFDPKAVDFLESIDVPAYKVASFEIVDMPLLKRIAQTGKHVIISTGMASFPEIEEAIRTLRKYGAPDITLLKCTSAYPALPGDMNLLTIPHMAEAFRVPVGLSDHTMGSAVAVAAVALGACIVEKHLTLSRKDPGPDSSFSMEPHELKQLIRDIRTVEKALGTVSYELTESQKKSLVFRRSLFVVQDVKAGEKFGKQNVRSIRPGHGLHPRYFDHVLGKVAAKDIERGTPLNWDLVA